MCQWKRCNSVNIIAVNMDFYQFYFLLVIFLYGKNGECGNINGKCTYRYFCDFIQGVFKCKASRHGLKVKVLNFQKLLTCYDKTYEITSLDLRNNGINNLKTGRKISNNVSEINLSNNLLNKLTGSMFYGFERLKRLSVSKNNIWHIEPNTFEKNNCLEYLNLSQNKISILDQTKNFTWNQNFGYTIDFEFELPQSLVLIDITFNLGKESGLITITNINGEYIYGRFDVKIIFGNYRPCIARVCKVLTNKQSLLLNKAMGVKLEFFKGITVIPASSLQIKTSDDKKMTTKETTFDGHDVRIDNKHTYTSYMVLQPYIFILLGGTLLITLSALLYYVVYNYRLCGQREQQTQQTQVSLEQLTRAESNVYSQLPLNNDI